MISWDNVIYSAKFELATDSYSYMVKQFRGKFVEAHINVS